MYDDQALVTAIQRGEAEAFAELVRRYHRSLLALAINAQGQFIIATRPDGKMRVVELLRK